MENDRTALRIGLTGGIGSGKSTVARIFRELHVPVVDADEIAHALVRPGMPALDRIVLMFGRDIVGDDGELDRPTLRQRIFADSAQRSALENLLHPWVYREMERRANALDSPYCILCIPLLLETARRQFVDRVLVIDCSTETQIQRARSRDRISEEDVQRILSTQISREDRLAIADDVIDNDGGLECLGPRVRDLHDLYLTLARTRRPHSSRAGDSVGPGLD